MVFGFLLIGKYNDAKTNLVQTTTAKDAAVKDAQKQKKAAEAAALAQADAEKKATDATAQVETMKGQLADVQKKADDATAALSSATDKAKAAQDALDKIKSVLGDKSPEDMLASVQKAEKDLETSESEKKILQDSLQSYQAQVVQLKEDINNSKLGIIPPGVSGKVTFVNPTWNFVVLDVGLANGVVPNGELIVYRGKTFLGKVKVTSAESNSSVADILPNVQGNIQVGDFVLN